jgi:hypothetical protein
MSPKKNDLPDFFEDNPFDPVHSATGRLAGRGVEKQKAGFYLSKPLLERFNRTFYEMKLEGLPIENKSALVELALNFTLDDLARGSESKIRKLL